MNTTLDPRTDEVLRRSTRTAWTEMAERPALERRSLRDPRRRRLPGWALSAAAAAAIVIVGGVVLATRLHGGSGSTGAGGPAGSSTPFPSYRAVHPSQANATSSRAGNPASQAIDGFTDTYWATDTATDAHPALTFTFDSPVDIDQLLVTPQLSPPFGAEGEIVSSPAQVTVTLVGSQGASLSTTLPDAGAPTPVPITGRGITEVILRVDSVHAKGPHPSVVAIAEVEFFTGSTSHSEALPSPPQGLASPPRSLPSPGGLTADAAAIPDASAIAPVIKVTFLERNIGAGRLISVGAKADMSLSWGCTDGTNPPSGGSTVTANVGAGQRFTADSNGAATGIITLTPNSSGMSCPAGQRPGVLAYRYTNITVQDSTTGARYVVSTELGGEA